MNTLKGLREAISFSKFGWTYPGRLPGEGMIWEGSRRRKRGLMEQQRREDGDCRVRSWGVIAVVLGT